MPTAMPLLGATASWETRMENNANRNATAGSNRHQVGQLACEGQLTPFTRFVVVTLARKGKTRYFIPLITNVVIHYYDNLLGLVDLVKDSRPQGQIGQ
jgi:hypothetical protein